MVNFIGGPTGGLPNSRAMGTKVTLAGRTAILPNDTRKDGWDALC